MTAFGYIPLDQAIAEEAGKSLARAPTLRGHITLLGDNEPFTPPDELIRDTIPYPAVGFLGGQSGALKSFTAIELAFCVMTGEPFAGRRVEKPGAVIFCAFEGKGTIKGRVKARRSCLHDSAQRLPLAMLDGFGSIAGSKDYREFKATLIAARDMLKAETGQLLRLVIVDTVAAAGLIPEDKENDPGSWQRVFDHFAPLAEDLRATIVLIHHFGKDSTSGLRGSSNARAGGDFVLAMTCQRDELTGLSTNHHLALSKHREAPEGPIASVSFKEVEIGQRVDGSPVKSLVLSYGLPSSGIGSRKGKGSRADTAFSNAITDALSAYGRVVRVHGDASGPEVKAVTMPVLKESFAAHYVTDSTDEKARADVLRKQLGTALNNAFKAGTIGTGAWSGEQYIWLITKGPKP